jgi:serine/threonine-protein kinase RsbW
VEAETVTVKVPPNPSYLALLRTAVGGFAARDQFTLDQVDDLRMAVEEAAVQLLRHTSGDRLQLDVSTTASGVEVKLHTDVAGDDPVIDESSFSWTILRALSDDLKVETGAGHATIVLSKNRIIVSRPQGS